jgi:ketosteroid isomerase-like protein
VTLSELEWEAAAAEAERYTAMAAGDLAALDRLLADDLVYTHSTGVRDTKDAYLASLRDGVVAYDAVDHVIEQVLRSGDTVLIFERMHARARLNGRPVSLSSKALAVWRRSGASWALIAYQPTPTPSPEPSGPVQGGKS